MQYKTAALFAVGLASSAAATGWLDQDAYSCPSNTDNQCTDSQQGGYDWSGLDEGSFDAYGSSSFSGFSCGNSYGKRDLLTKRTFQSKCIQGNLDEQPSMSCDQDDDRMSIDELEISTSHDADVECEYSMPDGSTCRETHFCSSGGSVVKNSQCGGARSVTFKPGKNAPSGCSVGVHSIGFNCNSASSSIPVASTPAPSTSSYVMTPGYTSRTAYTTSSAACQYGDDDCSTSSATPSSPVSSSAPGYECGGDGQPSCETSSAPATTATPGYTQCAYGEDCESSAVPSSPASSSPAQSCAYGDEDCSATPSSPASSSVPVESSSIPAPSCGGYGQPSCESSTIATPGYTSRSSSTENSPVGSSSVPSIPAYGGSTSSAPGSPVTSSAPYPTSSTQGIPGYGTGSASSSTANSPASSSIPTYPEPSCPGVLPKCLKTWLHVSKCKDSADSDCFCKDATFIKNVHECLPAWADNDEASAAASYLMGLCAPHVPENPGIITCVPSSITPVATPTYSQPASSAPASSAPVYSVSSSSAGSPVESEAPPPAYTPKTHTFWSTAEVTITSCGPEVTDCPAGSTVVQTTSTPVVSVETPPAETTPYSPVTTSSAGSPPEYTAPGSSPASPVTSSVVSQPAGYSPSSPAAPSAPGYTAPPAGSAPVTTVTFSSSVVAPATYSTGVSQGYEIPDSSYTTDLVTTITVPQVVMQTVTVTENGQETTSVGLGAGSPAPASATPTADAVGGQPSAGYGTGSAGWGTSYIPKPTQSGAPIEQVGNSGAKVGSSLAGLALGAVAAVMAL